MRNESAKRAWVAPKLEQIAIVDTAAKGVEGDESNQMMTASGSNS